MQKQNLFKMFSCKNCVSDLFKTNRMIFLGEKGPEYEQNVQAAQEQLVEAVAGLSTNVENKAFTAAQKKFNKAEKELAVAEKLATIKSGTEKKERSPDKCMQITRDFLNKNNLTEAGLKKYLGLADQADASTFVEKLKAKQRELGFKDDDVDGVFGKKTFNAMTTANKKDALTTLKGAEKPLFADQEKQKAQEALTTSANKLLEAYSHLPEVKDYDSPESLQFLTDFYKKYTETFAELNHYDQLIQGFDQFPSKITITLPGNRTVYLGVGNLARDFRNVVLGAEKNQRIHEALETAGRSKVVLANLATARREGMEIVEAATGAKEDKAEHNLAVYKNQVEEWAKRLAVATDEASRVSITQELYGQTEKTPSIFNAAGKTRNRFLKDIIARQKSLIAKVSSDTKSA